MKAKTHLDGQVLIAMPGMTDTRFANSLVYVCVHSESGAMGIIVNKLTPLMSFGDLASRLDILPEDGLGRMPEDVLNLAVHFGGPVEPGRGFVLHSSDYFSADSSLPVSERVALTATLDILRAMARGEGPRRAMLALGYSGWAPGQLEDEIQHNGWLHCAADDDLLFGAGHDGKYNMALRKLGVDPAMLSTEAGHA